MGMWTVTPVGGQEHALELIMYHFLEHQGCRAVGWRPNLGIGQSWVATASYDGTVLVWTHLVAKDGTGRWEKQQSLQIFDQQPALSLEWSVTGSQLAVTCADNLVHIFEDEQDDTDAPWVQKETLRPIR